MALVGKKSPERPPPTKQRFDNVNAVEKLEVKSESCGTATASERTLSTSGFA
jgi:hypothetical protein